MTRLGLSSIAIQTHRMNEMVAFCAEAFGGDLKEVDAGGFKSWFGQVAGISLKLVPLRENVDFEGYPVHQLGFDVASVDDVLAVALKHGGRQEGG
ncbi:VOC family protein [Candidatus Bipolaricaulota bacterium]